MDDIARIKDELDAALNVLAAADVRDKDGLALALGLVHILEQRLRQASRVAHRERRSAAEPTPLRARAAAMPRGG